MVAGVDANGKSTIVEDELTETRVALPAFTVNDIWRLDELPTSVDADDTMRAEVELAPPARGLVVRLATFPPDSEIDPEVYAQSIDTLHGEDANAACTPPTPWTSPASSTARSTSCTRPVRRCCGPATP